MRSVSALVSVVFVGLVAAGLASAAPKPDAMVNDLYESASRAFEEGDFPRAVTELTQAIGAAPTAKAHLLRATVYVKLGQIEEARADYERVLVLEKNPKLRAQVMKLKLGLDLLPKARLAISSQPPGATVFIDLKAEGAKGRTPVVVAVAPGRHRVMLELEGHETVVQKDVTAIDNQEVAVAIAMVPRGCDWKLASTPPGAIAKLDGKELGPTPLERRIVPGEHVLALSAPGYEPLQKSFKCVVGTAIAQSEPMVRLPEATLDLQVPAGASVALDGKQATGAPPYTLAEGDHQIEVTAPARAAWKTDLRLQSGQTLRLAPTLVATTTAQKSVAKSWWLWTSVAIVLAGVAVGVGVGVALRRESQFDIIRVFDK